MLQPVRRRTWAPRGQTPLQNAWDRHDRLSALGAISVSPLRRRLGLSFQLVRQNVDTETVVWFLTNLHYFLGRSLVVIWDRWSVHQAAARHFRTGRPHWFDFEWLPSYAPELNPVEPCWNHTKYAKLANFIPDDVDHLRKEVTNSINQQSKDQERLHSFFHYAKLTL